MSTKEVKRIIIDNLDLLKQLAGKFSIYQVAEIDLERLVYFLTQFDEPRQVKIMIKLLDNVDFLDGKRLQYLLKLAYQRIPETLTSRSLISSLGGIQDSSAMVCYPLLKEIFESEEDTLNQIADINSLGKDLEKTNPSCIIFFDDNITSGMQLVSFFDELIRGNDNAEMVKQPLTSTQFEKLKSIPIRVCYAIRLTEESEKRVEEIRNKYGLDLQVYVGKTDFNNYLNFQSSTMSSEEEAAFTQGFVQNIAKQLYEDKNWAKETIYSRLLGYGNLGKLTIFYYNVPKSFIPVFWKYGTFCGKPWIPLFPETQEQKKLVKDGIEMDYFQLEAVKAWINEAPNSREPSIDFGFYTKNGLKQEVTLPIPSTRFVEIELMKYLNLQQAELRQNRLPPRAQLIDFQSSKKSFFKEKNFELTSEEYERYKKAVEAYNEALDGYRKSVFEYILTQASQVKTELRVQNTGNQAATNCTVKLEYDTSKLLFDDFEELPQPKFNLKEPNIHDFDSSSKEGEAVIEKIDFGHSLLAVAPRKEPIEIGKIYEYKFCKNDRIGHNDCFDDKIKFSVRGRAELVYEIPYEINYDERGETFSGTLKIRFEEVETIDDALRNDVQKKIKELGRVPKKNWLR